MNEIQELLNRYEADKKRKRKLPYKKTQAVKDLENSYTEFYYKSRNTPQGLQIKKIFRDDTANGLTECVCKWLELNGFFAARINTTGTYSAKLKRYIYSGSKKGMADVTSVINGKHISIEIKIGKDKPRPEQMKVKSEIEKAGGNYIFVGNFDNFLEQINEIINLK